MNMSTALEVKNLTMKHVDHTVVHGVNLDVKSGECFGLLGPIESGKSSILKMIYCASKIDIGEVYILGLNAKKNDLEIKLRVGVVSQEDLSDPDFTVQENLWLFANYLGISSAEAKPRIQKLLNLAKLEAEADTLVENLDPMMKKRLMTVRALINSPEIVFFDEPTNREDKTHRSWMWDLIRKIKTDGKTIVLTTRFVEEAQSLCDRVALVYNGKIIATGEPRGLILDHIGLEIVEFETSRSDLNYYTGRLKNNGINYFVAGLSVFVTLQSGQSARSVIDLFSSHNIKIRKPTLNDVFLKIVGQNLEESQENYWY